METRIRTDITYLDQRHRTSEEKPYDLEFDAEGIIPQTNIKCASPSTVLITDIRGLEKQFTLARNGFEFITLSDDIDITSINRDEGKDVQDTYLHELGLHISRLTGCVGLIAFNPLIRKSDPVFPRSTKPYWNYEQPANVVHIDYVSKYIATICEQVGWVMNKTAYRYQIITVWRPIRGPVKRWPLAVCDVRTVDFSRDVQKIDIVYAGSNRESCRVYHSEEHRWYFLSHQEPREALIMLQSDSDKEIGAPHTAFEHPETNEDDEQRESIEVRFLLCYKKENTSMQAPDANASDFIIG
ncbi:Hypothetical protein D9617_101g101390 [Elsinoe fawcettii]|nr:Hypothetical protein D9617_101g101390 [Elsinoe fawcettii]